jgi:hypothetical protein
VAALGTPAISDNPDGAAPNHVGDNFDLAEVGPAVAAPAAARGFGDWGAVRANADAANLYLGGTNADLGGSNNVLVLFLGVDTLTDNAWNLWHKSGPPLALDFLHNVRFAEPVSDSPSCWATPTATGRTTPISPMAVAISAKASTTSAPTAPRSCPSPARGFRSSTAPAPWRARRPATPTIAARRAGRRRFPGARSGGGTASGQQYFPVRV